MKSNNLKNNKKNQIVLSIGQAKIQWRSVAFLQKHAIIIDNVIIFDDVNGYLAIKQLTLLHALIFSSVTRPTFSSTRYCAQVDLVLLQTVTAGPGVGVGLCTSSQAASTILL